MLPWAGVPCPWVKGSKCRRAFSWLTNVTISGYVLWWLVQSWLPNIAPSICLHLDNALVVYSLSTSSCSFLGTITLKPYIRQSPTMISFRRYQQGFMWPFWIRKSMSLAECGICLSCFPYVLYCDWKWVHLCNYKDINSRRFVRFHVWKRQSWQSFSIIVFLSALELNLILVSSCRQEWWPCIVNELLLGRVIPSLAAARSQCPFKGWRLWLSGWWSVTNVNILP